MDSEADEEPYDADLMNVEAKIVMDTKLLNEKVEAGTVEPFDEIMYGPPKDNPLIQEQDKDKGKMEEPQYDCDEEGKGHVEERDGKAYKYPGHVDRYLPSTESVHER